MGFTAAGRWGIALMLPSAGRPASARRLPTAGRYMTRRRPANAVRAANRRRPAGSPVVWTGVIDGPATVRPTDARIPVDRA